jgi:hypothetical protein
MPFTLSARGWFLSSLLKIISVPCTLWSALLTRRILPILLWITGLRNEKAVAAASGWSWPGETVACDVHRSLCGDISMAPLPVGASERSSGGSPLPLRSVAGNRSDRRGTRGDPSRVSLSGLVLTPLKVVSLSLAGIDGGVSNRRCCCQAPRVRMLVRRPH